MMEAPGDEHAATAFRPQGRDERARACDRRDPLGKAALDRAFFQPFQKCDSLGQRAGKIDLAAHGPFGNGGDLLLKPGEIGQLVDAFLADHGRIHVGHEQARHLDFVIRHQQVAAAEMVGEDIGDRHRLPLGQRDLQDVTGKIEHARQRHRRSRLCKRVAGAFQTRFELATDAGLICYQPGDDHA